MVEVCNWCAVKLSEKDLGEYERTIKRNGVKNTRGWYVCIRCENWVENLIQQKVTHTWMVIKARAERPCCGGGG